MNVGVLTLLGSLAAGGPTAPVPVPGMGPPGGAAGAPFAPPPGVMPGPALAALPQPGMGLPVPAPVLAARVTAPQGVRVAAHPGSPIARMYDTPAVFGLRPGYVYRFELSNLPYQPGRVLYPEVEVRGTLVPRPGMKYMDHPAPIPFSTADIERALAGAVVTKVVYLEDPEKAIPTQTAPDVPIEVPADTEAVAVREALDNGRLVAIVRLGNKLPHPDWLRMTAIEGTVLLPGERYLRAPVVPPTIPFHACKLYDPILGPKGPKEECLLDGGDRGDPLGIGPNDRVGGLDPTDVGVEYTIAGRRRVTTSNVVCLCSPRFVVQRAEVSPGAVDVPVAPAGHFATAAPQDTRDRRAPMADIGREAPTELAGRQRPMAYVGKVGLSFFIGTSRPLAIGQVEQVQVTAAVVEPEQLTAYPSLCPLTVTKTIDPAGPVPAGEEVTVTIKYLNTGNKPVSDLVVSDSLSGRLEYVAGSAQSDRAANFAAVPNDAGSVVVRWDLPGVLMPGQGGTVKFKARVR